MDEVQPEFMVFIGRGQEGVGAVREVLPDKLVIYVENAGEFLVPRSATQDVHDKKVILAPASVDRRLLDAVRHMHDSEDPRVAG